MKKLLFVLLFAAAVALALPHPSHAQAVTGMTLDQYMLMQERVDAFCNFFADRTKEIGPENATETLSGRPISIPTGLKGPNGMGLQYVFSPTESTALVKHCRNLMELMRKARQ